MTLMIAQSLNHSIFRDVLTDATAYRTNVQYSGTMGDNRGPLSVEWYSFRDMEKFMHRRTKMGFGNELLTDLSGQQATCYQTEVPGRSILLSSSPLPTS